MPERILIADDSLAAREAAQGALEARGGRVEALADGAEALERVRAAPARLLIADVHMPGLDGYALCREAKSARSDLRVLLVVGTFEPFDSQAATAAGADAVLRKPFTADELVRKVEDVIGPPVANEAPPTSIEVGQARPLADAEPARESTAPSPSGETAEVGIRLSDEEVERIARRVLAIGGEQVLERVARQVLGEAAAAAVRRAGAPGAGETGAPERE